VGFFKYAVQMGSGDKIYISSYIKIDSGIKKTLGRDTHTRIQADRKVTSKAYFHFLRNKKISVNV
jgi:hypothetical protein